MTTRLMLKMTSFRRVFARGHAVLRVPQRGSLYGFRSSLPDGEEQSVPVPYTTHFVCRNIRTRTCGEGLKTYQNIPRGGQSDYRV